MPKLELTDESSGFQTTTARNANNALIEAEFEKVLYRNDDVGDSSPMGQDLDMNSNNIINVADATNPSDVPSYGQLTSAVSNILLTEATESDLGYINARAYGMSPSNTAAANKVAFDAAVAASISLRKTLYIPMGFYEMDAVSIVPVGTQFTFHIRGDFAGRPGEIIPNSAESIKQYATVLNFPNLTGNETAISLGQTGGIGEFHRPIIEDIHITGPSNDFPGATPPSAIAGVRIIDGIRSPIFNRVNISLFWTGLITTDVFVFTSYSLGINKCQVGIEQQNVSNRMVYYDLSCRDCSYGMMIRGTGSTELYSPWFEGQPPTNDKEMIAAIVIGSQSDDIADISIYGGWWEQIQEEAIWVGYRNNGTNPPTWIASGGSIKRIALYGYGHWDSIGIDTGGTKIKVNESATGIEDGCVRIFGDLGNWDYSQIAGDADKVQSGSNFIKHAGNGLPIERWVTDKEDGAGGGTVAGFKTGIADFTATTFAEFTCPNQMFGSLFKVTYSITTSTERSVLVGEFTVALGRKSGFATQGSVSTPVNTTLNVSSTESNSAPVFTLTGLQAKDTADTTTETIGLQLTQDNTNSSDATIAYTVEQLTGKRQSGVGPTYIEVSQA